MSREDELFPSLATRRFFSVSEAARLLGISVPGIHLWIYKGRLRRPARVSRRGGYRIRRAEIVRLLKSAGREVAGLWTARRKKILLIEDDAQVRRVVAAALRRVGGEAIVETAATPEDGLLLVAGFDPDVILLDRFLPKKGMTSDQALAILRRARAARGVKIIGLWSPAISGVRGGAARADVYLPKPFSPDDLREAVLGKAAGSNVRSVRKPVPKPDRRRWEYRASRRPGLS